MVCYYFFLRRLLMSKELFFSQLYDEFTPDLSGKKEFCNAFNETYKAGLLDKKFIEQCVNVDRFKDRLAEIILAYKVLKCFGAECSSDEKGPDVKIKFSDKLINIESIRSSKVIIEVLGNFKVFEYDIHGQSKTYTQRQYYIDSNNFNLYAGNAIYNKTKKYNEYLKKGIVNSNDINVICFNTGFYKEFDSILINELKYFFYGTPVQLLGDVTPEGRISASICDTPGVFAKEITNENGEKETIHIDTAVFLNGITSTVYNNIDGVIIINENYISSPGSRVKGMFFQNRNRPEIPNQFLEKLGVKKFDDVDPEYYSINLIRKTGFIN